ncbi:carbohydrate kinase [Georgenia sp. TF02-10]|nr:carbohydrate kinase [Georgenia sp. TF02-10]UNX56322.1 carbohydrate kinase [Georgenia sp. TF02-10]
MVIGEALIDIVEAPGQEPREHPGGSPANVAVGLARLGRPVELVTWFAPDDRGATLRAHLEAENVSVSAASARAPRTSTARARLDETGAATYVFDLEWAPPAPEAGAPVHVHTGSIAAVLEPGDRTVLATVSRHRGTATISYDPNVRPDLMGTTAQTRPRVEALVNLADIIKASDEDLAWLYPELDPAQVARQWAGRGPALVVLTRGDAGSVAFTAAGAEVTVEATPVDVVDTVGAGDSYMAGILDGLWAQGLLGAGHREALRAVDPEVLTGVLRHASRVAGITVSRAGANPPTRAELTAARV